MDTNNNSLTDFISAYNELLKSYEPVFSKSFDRDIAGKNLSFVSLKRYVITNDIWNIGQDENHKFAGLYIELLRTYGREYEKELNAIDSIFSKNIPFSKEFTLNILKNENKLLFDFARDNGFSNEFLSFFSVLLVFPYRKAVTAFVKDKIPFDNHNSGLCPVCGHWPVISYLTEKEGRKILACICCSASWQFPRLKCSFCLNQNKEELGYLSIDGNNEVSAYVCDKCRRFIKTIRIGEEESIYANNRYIIDYLTTGDMDLAALQNKYLQESVLGTRYQSPHDEHLEKYLQKL